MALTAIEFGGTATGSPNENFGVELILYRGNVGTVTGIIVNNTSYVLLNIPKSPKEVSAIFVS